MGKIRGLNVEFSDLFSSAGAAGIYRYLTGLPMDYERHEELCQIEMQPKFSGLKIGAEVTRKLVSEIQGAFDGYLVD